MSFSIEQKVYQGVIKELQRYIEKNNLNPGDKLPSERELSERLKAGRSSVREALRALELIGLVETRHGEGTYLREYRSFQTVELLSSFILRQNNMKDDLTFTKKIMEKEAAKLAFGRISAPDIQELKTILEANSSDALTKHRSFFKYLFEKTENLLLMKIWTLMDEFSHAVCVYRFEESFYYSLLKLYSERDYSSIDPLFSSEVQVSS
ncbi:FadR/GntR family transcriptional regulator [Oceanobacillus polygoni]|uniref:GntR family transcriptional repressor for pyruvate dehydrogenase complex n=1 Tax=Oceanobacillus polygoni TaxID=1235259 RepID=A0A9X1CB53_9BACI|nr:GntR family transcriptional regulator [Oceanobacillus polygoni]MBP2077349.1 GntR family transcriptional repressor for pyruvate dehydrogenase complex [Oceanobacillus polygoni]